MSTTPQPCPVPDDPDYVIAWDEYQRAKIANFRKEAMLRERFGPNARLDDASGAAMRMELFIDFVLPGEDRSRVDFEILWQKLVAQSLENLHAQILEIEREAEADRHKKKLIIPGQGKGVL